MEIQRTRINLILTFSTTICIYFFKEKSWTSIWEKTLSCWKTCLVRSRLLLIENRKTVLILKKDLSINLIWRTWRFHWNRHQALYQLSGMKSGWSISSRSFEDIIKAIYTCFYMSIALNQQHIFIGNSIYHLRLELLKKFWKMRLKGA